LDTQKLRDTVNKIILGLGIMLFIGVMIPSVRDIIGSGMNILMSPILMLVGESNFFLILSAMAIITAIYSSLIQKYVVDQSKMLEFQERMKIFQKEMREAQKTQNTYMLKKLEEQQAEMMQEQMGMMKDQFKPMFYIVLVSIPLLMWAYYYIGLHPDASMIFPFWGEQNLSGRVFFMFTYWLFWYFMSSLAFSQVLRKFLNIRAAGM
jgi:Predicted membrane protein